MKRDIDAETAARYEKAIRGAGAGCRVEPVAPATPPAAAVEPAPQPGERLPAAPASAGWRARSLSASGRELTHRAQCGRRRPRAAPSRGGSGLVLAGLRRGTRPARPVAWLAIFVIWIVASGIAALIPVIGFLAATLFYPVVAAGIMLGADAQRQGEKIRVGHVFEGFRSNLGALVGVGAGLTSAGRWRSSVSACS